MPDHFELVSPYSPAGDQPKAIEQLMAGFNSGQKLQVLLGATGCQSWFKKKAPSATPASRTKGDSREDRDAPWWKERGDNPEAFGP